jgi:phenylalanyl-tRNA synthetase beta chain
VAGRGDVVNVAVPSWRADVYGKADLVEEVMRITGVDAVSETPLPREGHVATKVLTLSQLRRRTAKRTLATRGMLEAVTWSFISKPEADAFGGGGDDLALANPIASDLSNMRPSLLPGLLRGAQRNADRGQTDVALFEVGQVFHSDQPEGQEIRASGVRRGTAGFLGAGRAWDGAAPAVGVFDAKADALAVLEALGAPVDKLQVTRDAPAWYHPGRSGVMRLGPKVLAHFGELHPDTLETLDVSGPFAAFEVMIETLPEAKAKPTKSKGALIISDLMPVKRDFAFVVDEAIEAAAILKAVRGADKQLLTDATVFDVFRGTALGEGKKSVAVEITLQPTDKTLTDKDLEAIAAKIVGAVQKATGATLRG